MPMLDHGAYVSEYNSEFKAFVCTYNSEECFPYSQCCSSEVVHESREHGVEER